MIFGAIALAGEGGKLVKLANVVVSVPSQNTQYIIIFCEPQKEDYSALDKYRLSQEVEAFRESTYSSSGELSLMRTMEVHFL